MGRLTSLVFGEDQDHLSVLDSKKPPPPNVRWESTTASSGGGADDDVREV